MAHKELKTLLHIQIQNPLTHLVKINRLQRRLLAEQIFVYLSNDGSQAQDQWQKRLEINEKSLSVVLPSETIIIDILLEIIRGNGHLFDEEELGIRLKKRGVTVQLKQPNHVLTYYGLKKTDHEIIKLIRFRIDRLSDSIKTYQPFPQRPTLYFSPADHQCHCCSTELRVHKTIEMV